MKQNPLTTDPLSKAMKYCAYQERCHSEVIAKLKEWGVWGMEANEIVLKLIEGNFLNEERFALAYARGKFKLKKWGRIRIRRELVQLSISPYCIDRAMLEIDKVAYTQTLRKLMKEKWKQIKERNPLVRKNKTAVFLIGKGYEPALVWEMLKSFDSSDEGL